MLIPKIIHQIWSGIDEPLPDHFARMVETWKHDYPDWQYMFWDQEKIMTFIRMYYPQYEAHYLRFPFNIQRWDAIRYLILNRTGGLYVDFDYESLRPMEELLADKSCAFSQEPFCHRPVVGNFNNAMIASVPGHPFMRKIVERVFSEISLPEGLPKDEIVFRTTGQKMLSEIYAGLKTEEKQTIYMIPSEYVSPLTMFQTEAMRNGCMSRQFKECIRNAYAIHYYWGAWSSKNKKREAK